MVKQNGFHSSSLFNCLKLDASTGLLYLIVVIQINKVISLVSVDRAHWAFLLSRKEALRQARSRLAT